MLLLETLSMSTTHKCNKHNQEHQGKIGGKTANMERVKCNIDASFSSIWNWYMLAKTMSFSPIYPVEVG